MIASTGIKNTNQAVNAPREGAGVRFVDDSVMNQILGPKAILSVFKRRAALFNDGKSVYEDVEEGCKKGLEIGIIFLDATMPTSGVVAAEKIFEYADFYKKKVVIILQSSGTEGVTSKDFEKFVHYNDPQGNKIFLDLGGKLNSAAVLKKALEKFKSFNLTERINAAEEHNFKIIEQQKKQGIRFSNEDAEEAMSDGTQNSRIEQEQQITVDTNTNHCD